MTRVKPEDIEEWRKRREKGESYHSIAEDYNVALSTVYYHLEKKCKEDTIQRAKKSGKKKRINIGAKEKRRPCFFAYKLKDKEKVNREFRKIEEKDEQVNYLYNNEPLFSLYLLDRPSTVREIRKAHSYISKAFGIEPLGYTTLYGRLLSLCFRKEVERHELPRSEIVYKISKKGLDKINSRRGNSKIILEILKQHPEGLYSSELAVLFGIEKFGEPIPQPYHSLNKKYHIFSYTLTTLLRYNLIEKEIKPREESLKIGCPVYGFKRRYITYEELSDSGKRIIDFIEKKEEATIEDVANDLDMSLRTAKVHLGVLASANFIKRISLGTYKIATGGT